jgi:hypothetical protein
LSGTWPDNSTCGGAKKKPGGSEKVQVHHTERGEQDDHHWLVHEVDRERVPA